MGTEQMDVPREVLVAAALVSLFAELREIEAHWIGQRGVEAAEARGMLIEAVLQVAASLCRQSGVALETLLVSFALAVRAAYGERGGGASATDEGAAN